MMKHFEKIFSFYFDYTFSSHNYTASTNNRICIVKLDAIGDFFIMLSALKPFLLTNVLREDQLYIICDFNLVELGKSILKEAEFFGVKKKEFQDSRQYRMKIRNHLENLSFFKVVNLVYSRDKFSDLLVKWIPSTEKVGFRGDLAKQNRILDIVGQSFYSQLIEAKTNSEFIHLYQLLAFITEEPAFTKSIFNKHPSNRIVIFPGASWFGKAWPIENFFEIIKKIINDTQFNIAICGGSQESELAHILMKNSSDRIDNLVGKTSLLELVEIIRNSHFVLTNDTSAAHIAEFFETKALAIVGGGHNARFLPYKKEENYCEAIMNKMDCFGCHWNCIYDHGEKSVPCISSIKVEDVWSNIKEVLNEN